MNKDHRKKLENRLKKTIQREQRRNYIILYSVTFLVLIAMIFFSFSKNYFSTEEFIINIINNIIGILPAILIFDFFNEKLSRDSSAIEMSTKITEALMSNPETIDLFTEDQKQKFIYSTILSSVKDVDVAEMLNNNLQKYISSTDYKIRTQFDYNFELNSTLPATYDFLSNKDDYFYMQEKLLYKVKFLDNNSNIGNEVKVGFLFNNLNLDGALREKKTDPDFDGCIFRETLNIKKEDIEFFLNLSMEREEKIMYLLKMFKLDVQVDGCKGVLQDIIIKSSGILFKFFIGHDTSLSEHIVRLIFHMPKKWGSVLEVALVDPTKAPKISLSYPEDTMIVDMYSFLSKGDESSLEIAHENMNGIYDICINSEWIYPMSGIIFTIEPREPEINQ